MTRKNPRMAPCKDDRRSFLASEPEGAFHHRHTAAADMACDDDAVLLADAGQQQARSSEVDALPDPQRQLGVTLAGEIGEQCGGGGGGAASGRILGKAAGPRMKHPRLE